MLDFLIPYLDALELCVAMLCAAWAWAEMHHWANRRRLPSPEEGRDEFERLYFPDEGGDVGRALAYAESLGMSTYLHPQLLCGKQVGGRAVYHYLQQQRGL